MTFPKLLLTIGMLADPYLLAQSNSVADTKDKASDSAPAKANRGFSSPSIEINFQPYRNKKDEKSTDAMTQKWLNACKSIGQKGLSSFFVKWAGIKYYCKYYLSCVKVKN